MNSRPTQHRRRAWHFQNWSPQADVESMTNNRSESADLSAADPLGQQTRVAMLEPGVVARVCCFESLHRSSHHRRHHHHHHLLLLLLLLQTSHHLQWQVHSGAFSMSKGSACLVASKTSKLDRRWWSLTVKTGCPKQSSSTWKK